MSGCGHSWKLHLMSEGVKFRLAGSSAFDSFYREHYMLVLRFAERRVDHELARDVPAKLPLRSRDGQAALRGRSAGRFGVGPRITFCVTATPPGPSWPSPEPNPANPSRDVGPLWILDRRSGQLWLGARLPDLLRAIEETYEHQLPGNSRSAAEAMAVRRRIAERIEGELAELSLRRDGWPDLDPTTVGSLLRGLAGVGLVSFGRL